MCLEVARCVVTGIELVAMYLERSVNHVFACHGCPNIAVFAEDENTHSVRL